MEQKGIVGKLEQVAEHVQKAVDAAKHDDWGAAEDELHRAQVSMTSMLRLVELANDIQRGQVP